jgi:hypothetical protein
MSKSFKAVLNDLGETVKEGLEIAKHTYEGIKKDVEELVALGETRLNRLIDALVEDDTIRKMASAFFKNVVKGKDAAVAALRSEYAKCQQKLDDMVEDKPEIVGFWDGFASIFLATQPDRRPRSRVYTTHVRYGKVIASASAVLLFFGTGRIAALIGSVPVIVRGAEYLKKKILDAKVEAGARKSGG